MNLRADIEHYRQMILESKAVRDAEGIVCEKGDAQHAAITSGDDTPLFQLAGVGQATAVANGYGQGTGSYSSGNGAPRPAATAPKLASDKQLAFATKLLGERETSHAARLQAEVNSGALTSKRASELIDWLLKAPKKATTEVRVQVTAPAVTLAEGLYAVGEDVYKIRTSRSSGHLYASKLIPATEKGKKGSWDYAPGATSLVAREGRVLDKEVAAELGHAHGWCAVCGAYLENKESVERGIGPVCFGKL